MDDSFKKICTFMVQKEIFNLVDMDELKVRLHLTAGSLETTVNMLSRMLMGLPVAPIVVFESKGNESPLTLDMKTDLNALTRDSLKSVYYNPRTNRFAQVKHNSLCLEAVRFIRDMKLENIKKAVDVVCPDYTQEIKNALISNISACNKALSTYEFPIWFVRPENDDILPEEIINTMTSLCTNNQ